MCTNEHHGLASGSLQSGFRSPDLLDIEAGHDSGCARRVDQGSAGTSPNHALADGLGSRLGPAATFVTTEHFNLQSARALTVSEANGRASIYLAALSGHLIALAFVGQISRLGLAFYVFALVLMPVSAFIGVVTFLRLVQSSIEEIAYARRIGVLRGFYLRVAPELEPFIVAVHGTRSSVPADEARVAPSPWQLALTVAGMIAVINSAVVGTCVGLALASAGVHSLAVTVAAGAVAGAGALALHGHHHRRASGASCPRDVDRAAIYIPESEPATHPERGTRANDQDPR